MRQVQMLSSSLFKMRLIVLLNCSGATSDEGT